jgi:hypothetical protein
LNYSLQAFTPAFNNAGSPGLLIAGEINHRLGQGGSPNQNSSFIIQNAGIGANNR